MHADQPSTVPPQPPNGWVSVGYALICAMAILCCAPGMGMLGRLLGIPIVPYSLIVGLRELAIGDRRHGTILWMTGGIAFPTWMVVAPGIAVELIGNLVRLVQTIF